tara:strand:- start:116 stop:628 length:513 start_codon:yes stop_codon:yes gene_type:complete
MIKTINGHAIWGLFADEDMNCLKKIQSKVYKKLRGPSFEIHLTLLSPYVKYDEKKIYQIEKICEKVKPIGIVPSGFAEGDTFFNSVFLEIKKTRDLLKFRENFLNLVNFKSSLEFFPHISLVYGNFPKKLRNQVIKELKTVNTKLNLDRICIVDICEDISSWKIIKTIFL